MRSRALSSPSRAILCSGGFLIWAASHIPANGTLVAILLFGGMVAFSNVGFLLLDFKARKRMGLAQWNARSAGTSIIPFLAMARGRSGPRSLRPLILPALAAIAAYAWFVRQGHALLIGPDPLSGLLSMS